MFCFFQFTYLSCLHVLFFFIIVYQCHDSVNFGNKLGSVLVRDEQSQNEIFVVDNKLKIGSSN